MNLAAGSNVTLTTAASTDTVTIASTGGGSDVFKTISIAGEDDVVADSETDTLTLVAGSNVTMSSDASTDTITINSTASGGGGSGNEISFFAHRDNVTQSIPVGSSYVTMELDNTDYNVGSCYSTTTYKFTPTTAGKYLLGAAVRFVSTATSDSALLSIFKNGQQISMEGYGLPSPSRNTDSTVLADANGSTDYFEVKCYLYDSEAEDISGHIRATNFWGILVGGTTSSDSFKTISVSGQDDVVADSSTDSLTLVAGNNTTITTDASTDSVTVTADNAFSDILVVGESGGLTAPSDGVLQLRGGTGITLSQDTSIPEVTITASGGSSSAVTTVTDADSVVLDFDDDQLQILDSDRSGSSNTIAFTTDNRGIGKTITLRLKNTASFDDLEGTTAAWLEYPSAQTYFEGGSYLSPDKYLLLKLTCWGTAETDVTAEWIDGTQS